jgi:hypothetical protein
MTIHIMDVTTLTSTHTLQGNHHQESIALSIVLLWQHQLSFQKRHCRLAAMKILLNEYNIDHLEEVYMAAGMYDRFLLDKKEM